MRHDLAAASPSDARRVSWRGGRRPDQEVEDPHLGERARAAYQLPSELAQRRAIPIQVALVAADERRRMLAERFEPLRVGLVIGQIPLDDAVEDRDQRGPLLVQRLRRLREADAADV